ncbi:MAG: hypothetical protein ABIQ51_05215 [Mesorhizobium sp.]
MRSFTLKTSIRTAAIAVFLAAVPLAGAYAAGHHKGTLDATEPTDFTGPRVTGLMDQLQGIRQGIVDAKQANTITPAVAQQLEMRVSRITQAAEKTAAADHGRIPAAQYHQLLHRVDNLDQRLMIDTGSGFNMGDGSDGGNYPNG